MSIRVDLPVGVSWVGRPASFGPRKKPTGPAFFCYDFEGVLVDLRALWILEEVVSGTDLDDDRTIRLSG